MNKVVLGLILLAPSCVSTKVVEPEFHVLASSPEVQAKAVRYTDDLLPQIREMFGAQDEEQVFIAVVSESKSEEAELYEATSNPYGIFLYREGPEMEGLLAHEIAHIYMHHRESFWNVLPIVLEEGLARLLEVGINGSKRAEFIGSPTLESVKDSLGLNLDDYGELTGDLKTMTTWIGVFMVASIGFDELERLAMRAYKEKHEIIPIRWITEALNKALHQRNHVNVWEIDPLFGKITPRSERTLKATITFSQMISSGS